MDALNEATAALRAAEQQLRCIIAKAAEGGDYDDLPQIAEWAKILAAALNGRPASEPASVQAEMITASPSDNGVHPRAAAVGTRTTAPCKAKAGRRKKARRRKKTNAEYPKFIREGDSLVKIGWSKSETKTYEHKAPIAVLRALVQALVRVGAGGKRFTVEQLLPLKSSGPNSEIPDYQTYLTLAWLRSVDLITQHGRQGYSLLPDIDLEQESTRHWDRLDTR